MRVAGAERTDLQMPRDVVEALKFSVFGYDTLWVTQVDNYKAEGVVFKGNLRAKDPQAAYERLAARLKDAVGDAWQIFLVEDKDERPTAVVLPSAAREGEISRFTEVRVRPRVGRRCACWRSSSGQQQRRRQQRQQPAETSSSDPAPPSRAPSRA